MSIAPDPSGFDRPRSLPTALEMSVNQVVRPSQTDQAVDQTATTADGPDSAGRDRVYVEKRSLPLPTRH